MSSSATTKVNPHHVDEFLDQSPSHSSSFLDLFSPLISMWFRLHDRRQPIQSAASSKGDDREFTSGDSPTSPMWASTVNHLTELARMTSSKLAEIPYENYLLKLTENLDEASRMLSGLLDKFLDHVSHQAESRHQYEDNLIHFVGPGCSALISRLAIVFCMHLEKLILFQILLLPRIILLWLLRGSMSWIRNAIWRDWQRIKRCFGL